MQTFIRWPMETYDGHYLLYLLEVPRVVRGEGQCAADYVNPLNVTVSPLQQLSLAVSLSLSSCQCRNHCCSPFEMRRAPCEKLCARNVRV